ncbi:lipopolysaccharide biosynthesis protein [Modestobacter italicus]|uniref:lipopolysaccharide biosynthesis protein n=1 Tax=Modestobacter italicus (strain DSM 44449 / CECT 9708 / BC 501) TaxID=2732864 RepID=UPI001C94942B|nr:hypothetical protein [Modestobacter italicus]
MSGPLLAHALGADGRGELAGFLAPFVTVAFITSYGLTQRAGHLVARGQWSGRAAARSVATVAPFSAVGVLAALSGEPPSLQLLAVSAVLGHNVSACVQGAFLGSGLASRFNVVLLAPYGANLAVLVAAFAVGRLTPTVALTAQLGAFVIAGCLTVSLYWVSRGAVKSTEVVPSTAPLSSLPAQAVAGLSAVSFAGFDQAVISFLADDRSLGLFAVAFSYAALLETVVVAISLSAFSAISNDHASRKHMVTAQKQTALLSVLGAVFLAAAAPLVIPVMFGEDFKGSVVLTWVLLFGRIFHDLYGVVAVAVTGARTARSSLTVGLASLLMVGSGLVLGWHWGGILGCAIGIAIAEVSRWLLALALIRVDVDRRLQHVERVRAVEA